LELAETSEEQGEVLIFNAYSSVLNVDHDAFQQPVVARLNLNRALICKFDRILYQVDQDLFEALHIPD
jgi:hypothetical protein